jgi:hypothetical protein
MGSSLWEGFGLNWISLCTIISVIRYVVLELWFLSLRLMLEGIMMDLGIVLKEYLSLRRASLSGIKLELGVMQFITHFLNWII